jgi:transposase
MEFITGASRDQIILLPDSIEDYVEDNNSVRVIEAYINSLDLSDVGFSRSQPRDTGRPMYDPKDLFKRFGCWRRFASPNKSFAQATSLPTSLPQEVRPGLAKCAGTMAWECSDQRSARSGMT